MERLIKMGLNCRGEFQENPLNKLLFTALQTIIKALVGALNYERIKQFVVTVQSTELSGPEKRAKVLEDCQAIAVVVGTALVNLAIEIAVNAIKDRK